MSCDWGYTACGTTNSGPYECVDTNSHLENCTLFPFTYVIRIILTRIQAEAAASFLTIILQEAGTALLFLASPKYPATMAIAKSMTVCLVIPSPTTILHASTRTNSGSQKMSCRTTGPLLVSFDFHSVLLRLCLYLIMNNFV